MEVSGLTQPIRWLMGCGWWLCLQCNSIHKLTSWRTNCFGWTGWQKCNFGIWTSQSFSQCKIKYYAKMEDRKNRSWVWEGRMAKIKWICISKYSSDSWARAINSDHYLLRGIMIWSICRLYCSLSNIKKCENMCLLFKNQ